MKKNISKKIIKNTITIVIVLALILVSVMAVSMKTLTDNIMEDILPSTIKTTSQSIEGNIHMLADRIFMIGDNEVITRRSSSLMDKEIVLNKAQTGIEFVWLGIYDASGKLSVGNDNCPASIEDKTMFPLLKETQNLVIDDVTSSDGDLEFAIGMPILSGEELLYYLVGSYKYDVLNDVLSNINLSANGTAYITDASGNIMGTRDTELVKEHAGLAEITGINGIVEKVSSGEIGVTAMKSNYVGYAPINGTRWYLTIIVPRGDFMGPANISILISILITGILIALAIMITLRFSARIQTSLKSVTGRIGLLAKGDLKTPTEIIHTEDETEVLSVALNNTISNINGYISELSDILEDMCGGNFKLEVSDDFDGDFIIMKESLNKIIDSLNNIFKAIKKSSDEVLQTAGTVSDSAGQVHNGSTEQSNSLNVLSDETSAIEQNIQEVNENTDQVSSLVETAKKSIGAGNENMANLLHAMDEINRNSIEITKINELLEAISNRTNLLALNASIEAAQAGTAGTGFAVVADEVRKLAEQSADSSKRTADMISNSLQAVEQGTTYAKKAASSFHDIEEVSSRISVITGQLAESVAVQKQSLSNISGQINQIRDFAQQNLDASYESTTASQKLNTQAQNLRQISDNFKLREDERYEKN